MNKIKYGFLVVLSFFMFSLVTSAASKCEYSELAKINQEASAVKISYEQKQRKLEGDNGVMDTETGKVTYDIYENYFAVNITNVTDDLYVKVVNPNDNSIRVFSSADATNGVISFEWNDTKTVTNLQFKVYTSSKTSCADEEVVVQYKTMPMYNYYSTSAYCSRHPKEDVCQRYVTKEVSAKEIEKRKENEVSETVEKSNKENQGAIENITDFIKKNKKGFVIGGSIIIVLGVVATVVVIIKRRRSRLI